MRDWLAARPDPAFDAVKYRASVKEAVRHAHLKPAGELGPFLFTPHRPAAHATPILDTWRRAHYERAALYELPYTVAEGFAAKHRIPREAFLERIAPRLTRLERLRLQESARDRVGTRALRHGLSPRVEEAYTGAAVRGLEDALRIFEIHAGQCGVLVYVADALAVAFVVPHPADYRALHGTFVHDLYGELIYHYALLSMPVPDFRARPSVGPGVACPCTKVHTFTHVQGPHLSACRRTCRDRLLRWSRHFGSGRVDA